MTEQSQARGTEDAERLARRNVIAVCAEASVGELRAGLEACGVPEHRELRAPETGLVMVRGRIGGDGAAFNLGEATVTRAAVQIENGPTGFSYVLGRDREKARLAALADALWQDESRRPQLETHLLLPVRTRLAAETQRGREEVAATRVNFFTLVRGED